MYLFSADKNGETKFSDIRRAMEVQKKTMGQTNGNGEVSMQSPPEISSSKIVNILSLTVTEIKSAK